MRYWRSGWRHRTQEVALKLCACQNLMALRQIDWKPYLSPRSWPGLALRSSTNECGLRVGLIAHTNFHPRGLGGNMLHQCAVGANYSCCRIAELELPLGGAACTLSDRHDAASQPWAISLQFPPIQVTLVRRGGNKYQYSSPIDANPNHRALHCQ